MLGVDSLSIIFNPRSFQETNRFPWEFDGFDSPFFSTIALFKNQPFPPGVEGFVKRRIPGKNREGTLEILAGPQENRLILLAPKRE